jgi:hypothetical protein
MTPLMIVASMAYYPWRHIGSWMTAVILIGAIIVALWHLALIIFERLRGAHIIYALINLPLYVFFSVFGLSLVTGDSL